MLDKWFEEQIKPRLESGAFMVRYADDFVMGFKSRRDAERVLEVLRKRLAKFGLELHAGKTRLIDFRPSDKGSRPFCARGKAEKESVLCGLCAFCGQP